MDIWTWEFGRHTLENKWRSLVISKKTDNITNNKVNAFKQNLEF